MSEAVFGPLVTASTTVLFGWLLIRGFRTGSMNFPQPGFTMSGQRASQPIRFWGIASFLAFLVLASALATIGQLFFPHGV